MSVLKSKFVLLAMAAALPLVSLPAMAQSAVSNEYKWLTFAVFGSIIAFTMFVTYLAAKRVKTAKDFYTAGGGVSGIQNGWAIAGDYLSAASFLGIAGLISIRLGRLRAGNSRTSTIARATSSGSSFQSAPLPGSLPEKPVATDPGRIVATRMLSPRSSCISASLNALTPAFDATYAAPPGNGPVDDKLETLMIQPPPRVRR